MRMTASLWVTGRPGVRAAGFGGGHGGCGATYTVSSDADGGLNTLRWAIRRANERVGPDTITFTAEMATRTIAVTSVLPSLTDRSLTIDGDLDDDGAAGDGKVDDSAAL